jgi:hypothetical protein
MNFSEIDSASTSLDLDHMNVNIDAADAVELSEILALLSDWLASDPNRLDASLHEFLGSPNLIGPPATLDELRADLDRFADMLLGYNRAIQ